MRTLVTIGAIGRAEGPATVVDDRGNRRPERAVAVSAPHRTGPDAGLDDRWAEPGETPSVLVALAKADLARRLAAGEPVAAADYLDACPALRADADLALSLIYEEYCLREEAGEAPDPDSFCDRYEPWADSLASQLRYHRVLSQAAGLPMAAPRFPDPGESFLRYRLDSVLGQGGAARVYLAYDEDLGDRPSALKVSHDRGEEPKIMGRLKHAHIMPVHHVVRDPETGLRGLCMPYLPGRPLDQVLKRMGRIPLPARTAATLLEAAAPEDLADRPEWAGYPRDGSYADGCTWIAAALADALGHAHALGILHRDVKPANVLLTAAEGPKLLDFNLAHDPHAPERAESALRGGTLPYMAPEQLEAFLDPDRWEEVGPTADLYALGLVLVELLTGERPEAPDPALALPRSINDQLTRRAAGPPPVRVRNPGVPHALEAILHRCLANEPTDRYPTADALADDLRRYLDRRPALLAPNPSPRERVRFWFRRHRLGLIGLATTAALAALVAAFLMTWTLHADWHVDQGDLLLSLSQQKLGASEQQRLVLRERAERRFRWALWLEPSNYRPYMGLALVAKERGDEETMLRWFRKARDLLLSQVGLSDDVDVMPLLSRVCLEIAKPSIKASGEDIKEHENDPAGHLPPDVARSISARLRGVLPDLELALQCRRYCRVEDQAGVLMVVAGALRLLAVANGDKDKDAAAAARSRALGLAREALVALDTKEWDDAPRIEKLRNSIDTFIRGIEDGD